jgi:hypothetical protein
MLKFLLQPPVLLHHQLVFFSVRKACSIVIGYVKARHYFGNVGVDGGVTVTFISRNRV